ncbi:MAG: insulinase family protein [Candidatus Magasanikbacteria bacterium]|nr:insulinase family protein [Candidatus Magasanikbacteria bacterium]
MYEFQKLKNGVKVCYVPLEHTKSVTVLVMYAVGSRDESEKLSGASHFIEHLMFKGTKKRKNTLILTREIDRLGAEYNAFTSKEYTGYYIKSDSSYIQKSLDILSDMLFDSLFLAREMEREKKVIVEEIKMYNDNPMMNIDTVFENVLYKNALGRDIAGTVENVLSFKRDDVLKFKDKFYQPKNMTIVVAGNLDDNIKKYISEYFEVRQNNKIRKVKMELGVFGSTKKVDRLVVQEKDTSQAQIMLGFPAFSRQDKDGKTLSVLNSILGGSMSSRLFMQIRERRGLAYMVRSGQEKFKDTGYSFVRVGLDSKNINKTIKIVEKELENIKTKGVSVRELKDVKTRFKGSMSLSMEDSSAVASWFAHQIMFMDEIKTPDQVVEEIRGVSLSDVKRVANKIFKPSKMRLAVIGKINKKEIIF